MMELPSAPFVLENDTHPFLSRPVATVTKVSGFVFMNFECVGSWTGGKGGPMSLNRTSTDVLSSVFSLPQPCTHQ